MLRLLVAIIFISIFAVQTWQGSRKYSAVHTVVKEPLRPLLNALSWLSTAGILAYISGTTLPAALSFSALVKLTGCLSLLLGLLLWLFSQLHLSHFWSQDISVFKGHQLITSGPYKYIRHPIYLALILLASGLLFVSGNLIESLPLLIYSFFVLSRITHEDSLLESHFGNEFTNYRKRTGSILPCIRKEAYS